MKWMLLGRRRRKRVREIAHQAYLDRNGDQHAASVLAESRVREEMVGGIFTSILISIAVQLAVKLIIHWWKNRVSKPQYAFQPDEPGYTE